MRFWVMIFLFPTVLLETGCGENAPGFEEVLGKVFITGRDQGESTGTLSKETVEKLNLDVDDEATVVSNLIALKDKEFNIDVDDEQKKALTSLNYLTTIVRRSALLPKEKQSPCQCHYAVSTFKLAVEVLGEYLLKLKQQNLLTRVKDELDIYQQLYDQFSLGKEILEALSKVDILRLPVARDSKEREGLEEIKKAATEALKKLSSGTIDDSSKSSETRKGNRDEKSESDKGSLSFRE